jgi:hypothetical protein
MSCDDYCNNHGCNNGPFCPAKAYNTKPAAVARVGKRMPDREPLRGTPWRSYLKYLAVAMLMVMAVIAVSGLTVQLLEKPKLQSNCPGLIESYKITGVPKHIQIKCKEYL